MQSIIRVNVNTVRPGVAARQAQLLRPAIFRSAQLRSSSCFRSRSSASCSRLKRRLTTSAAQSEGQSSADPDQIQSPTGSDIRPEVSQSKLPAAAKEEPRVGLAGSIIMWAFLVFLFAGSLFFTFSRSFLPDMQPLDANSPELTS